MSSLSSSSSDACGQSPSSTVWIGNLSSKASESQVLKFSQSVGRVEKFDFMYHGGGETSTCQRIPRGYAFATYCNYAVATEAIRKLNGQTLCGRSVTVQPATSSGASRIRSKDSNLPKSLSMSLKSTVVSGAVSKEEKIKAMELKLKALEGGNVGEFVVVPAEATKVNTCRHKTKPYDPPASSKR